MRNLIDEYPSLLLLAGFLTTCITHLRYGSSIVAWIANIPFVWYLHKSSDCSILLFVIVVCLAWTVTLGKIVTKPLTYAMCPSFGVPIGIVHASGFLLWKFTCLGNIEDTNNNNNNDLDLQALGFAACMVVLEWIQHRFTPFGCWGAMANTQLTNLPLLQLTSITGLAGPSFLIYWFSAMIAVGLNTEVWCVSSLGLWSFIMAVINVWGTYRLEQVVTPENTVTVAAVGTDATFGAGSSLPSPAELDKVNDNLWKRTEQAAKAGKAKLVSWTEAATLVKTREDESKLLQQAQQCAKTLEIEFIVAYIIPVNQEGTALVYENKAVWIRPNGEIHDSYLKNEPVPGEPAIKGDCKKTVIVETSFGARASLAICYDYDFPYLSRKHAAKNTQLAIVPSSDWLGIDPIHTQMAAIRGIEGGFAVLRTTRMGLSGGMDAFGRVRGQLSANETKERILITTLPIEKRSTWYGKVGDVLVYASIVCVLGLNVQNFFLK